MAVLDRAAFATLVETPKGGGAIRRAHSGRLLTDLTRAKVMDAMGPAARATFLGSMSGGDEGHVVTRWAVPGLGRRTLIIERDKLRAVLARLETVEQTFDPLEPEPAAQGQLFG